MCQPSSTGFRYRFVTCDKAMAGWLNDFLHKYFNCFTAQMHALALKDKEEEHAGLLHTAGEIQVLL